MDKQKENKISNICSGGGVEFYREKITEMTNCIENLDYLEFIYNMMISFKKKWGI